MTVGMRIVRASRAISGLHGLKVPIETIVEGLRDFVGGDALRCDALDLAVERDAGGIRDLSVLLQRAETYVSFARQLEAHPAREVPGKASDHGRRQKK
jgi:hypothetical protein